MKTLILTQYFPPEVGAPQNRLYEVAVRLQKKGIHIEVLTAMPNYPSMQIHTEYRGKWYIKESMNGIQVHRTWIWASRKKGILPRLLNYFSFVFTSFWVGVFKLKKADYLFCESPPLFLGITAVLLKKIRHYKLIFNVSDLWPESAEKLGLIKNTFLLKICRRLEEYIYSQSFLITGQTQGIVKNIKSRFPDKTIYWLPNGVDLEFYDFRKNLSDWREEHSFSQNDFLILYAGIIGHAQGLEVALKAAEATINKPDIKWILLGNGPEKNKLALMKEKMGLSNVYFFESVSKSKMPAVLKAVNVSLIPLRKLELFKGALPSKSFEAMAMKKPILLGAEGEAEYLFIKKGRAGLSFTPEDANDLASKALCLYNDREIATKLGENGYAFVKNNFNRNIIAENFYVFLTSLN